MRRTNTALFTNFFLSKSLKQTKAGPRSSGTPFLVYGLIYIEVN